MRRIGGALDGALGGVLSPFSELELEEDAEALEPDPNGEEASFSLVWSMAEKNSLNLDKDSRITLLEDTRMLSDDQSKKLCRAKANKYLSANESPVSLTKKRAGCASIRDKNQERCTELKESRRKDDKKAKTSVDRFKSFNNGQNTRQYKGKKSRIGSDNGQIDKKPNSKGYTLSVRADKKRKRNEDEEENKEGRREDNVQGLYGNIEKKSRKEMSLSSKSKRASYKVEEKENKSVQRKINEFFCTTSKHQKHYE